MVTIMILFNHFYLQLKEATVSIFALKTTFCPKKGNISTPGLDSSLTFEQFKPTLAMLVTSNSNNNFIRIYNNRR